MHQHFYEPDQANVILDQYHREAIQAEQLRAARSTHPGAITTLTMRFQAAIGTMVTAVGAGRRCANAKAVAHEPVTASTLRGEPAESPAGA